MLVLASEPVLGMCVSEESLESMLSEYLTAHSKRNRRQMSNAAGVADIVTDDAIYEVKLHLTRSKYLKAIGQVLLYRQAINPGLRAVVVGPKGEEELPTELAAQIGVETWLCDDIWELGQIISILFAYRTRHPRAETQRLLLRYLRRLVDVIAADVEAQP